MIRQLAGISLTALLTACPAKEEPKTIPNHLGISAAEYCQHHADGMHMETATDPKGRKVAYAIACNDGRAHLFAGTFLDEE